jgi:hypothetical protein
MTTIAWTIEWMESSTQTINGYTEVVLTAGWRCTGTEANTATPPVTFTSTAYGTCSFPEPQAGGSFTPYAQLTQSQVLGWCWANGVNQTEIEASISANLTAQLNPTQVTNPLPWATPTP